VVLDAAFLLELLLIGFLVNCFFSICNNQLDRE
jgi:hypothetical protein